MRDTFGHAIAKARKLKASDFDDWELYLDSKGSINGQLKDIAAIVVNDLMAPNFVRLDEDTKTPKIKIFCGDTDPEFIITIDLRDLLYNEDWEGLDELYWIGFFERVIKRIKSKSTLFYSEANLTRVQVRRINGM